jgi:hypothetical protein
MASQMSSEADTRRVALSALNAETDANGRQSERGRSCVEAVLRSLGSGSPTALCSLGTGSPTALCSLGTCLEAALGGLKAYLPTIQPSLDTGFIPVESGLQAGIDCGLASGCNRRNHRRVHGCRGSRGGCGRDGNCGAEHADGYCHRCNASLNRHGVSLSGVGLIHVHDQVSAEETIKRLTP